MCLTVPEYSFGTVRHGLFSLTQRLHLAVRLGRVHRSPGVSPSYLERRRHIDRGTRTSSSSCSEVEGAGTTTAGEVTVDGPAADDAGAGEGTSGWEAGAG